MSLLCPRKVGYIVGQSAVYRIETLPILCDKMDGNLSGKYVRFKQGYGASKAFRRQCCTSFIGGKLDICFRIKLLSYSAWKSSIGMYGAWFRPCSRYYNERRSHESLDNLTPRDVYLGQGEKIKKIRETIKQNSINKRISENKRMILQHK